MRTYSPWQRALAPAACDVAVVGAGVIGAATAYALGRMRPGLRVAVLEGAAAAFGASGRNAGFLLPGVHTDYASAVEAYGRDRARRLWAFTAENVRRTAALDGEAFGLRLSGSFLAAGSPAEAERLARAAALLAEDADPEDGGFEYLDAPAAEGRTGMRGFAAALDVPLGGTLHPAGLVRYLLARSGAALVEGWEVRSVEPSGGGVRLEGPEGRVEAGRVVLALNAFLPRLWPEASRYVRPVRAQMLATAPVPSVLDRPVYSHEGYYYLRQSGEGRLLLGGARHRHVEAEVGYEDATTEPLQADLLAYLREHLPLPEVPPVERRWSGTMGFSPDGLPVLGEISGCPGAWFACGFTGHGMGYAVRFGELLARTALGEPDEASDLFAAERLG
jgi:gamma-glutamylputrescine oxidase